MDTQIFNLKLSIYANSAYILACSLTIEEKPPSLQALIDAWNGEPEQLTGALKELLAWHILEESFGPEGQTLFLPNPASLWQMPKPLTE
jgi:hypothetical protein